MCLLVCMLSFFNCVRLFSTPWSIACQVPLSVGFSRQERWSGLPCPPLGDLPDPGTEPASSARAARFFSTEPPGRPDALPIGTWIKGAPRNNSPRAVWHHLAASPVNTMKQTNEGFSFWSLRLLREKSLTRAQPLENFSRFVQFKFPLFKRLRSPR